MLKKLIVMMALILGLSSLAACGSNNQVVVKTKGGNITQADFYKALKQDSSSSQVLQTLVYEKLLEQNYKVSNKEVNDKIKEYKKNYSSDAEFKAALAQNNMTESQFKNSVKDSLLLTKAQTAGIKITDKDMHNYYNKNKTKLIELKASHILVKDKKTADAVEKKIKDGVDFAKLAKQYSTDTGSKTKGGELGWFKQSSMVSEFSKAAMKLKVGQISAPVKSKYGYHIIKLEGIKDSYDELKSSTREAVKTSKEKSQQEVLQELIKKGKIQVKDKQFKDLFSTQSLSTTTQQ